MEHMIKTAPSNIQESLGELQAERFTVELGPEELKMNCCTNGRKKDAILGKSLKSLWGIRHLRFAIKLFFFSDFFYRRRMAIQ